jgi:hypothetical protein
MDIIGSKRTDGSVPYTKEAYGGRGAGAGAGAGSIDSCSSVESILLSRSTCLAGSSDDVGNDAGVLGRHVGPAYPQSYGSQTCSVLSC